MRTSNHDTHSGAVAPIDWDAHKGMFAGQRPALGSPRTVRAKPRQLEHLEAVALATWRDRQAARFPELELLYAIPNGGQRSKAVAGKMKAEGVKAGVSDYHLPVARGGFFGLWIELKASDGRREGRASDAQDEWLTSMRAQGHQALVCVGWTAATVAILDYLAKPATIVATEVRP